MTASEKETELEMTEYRPSNNEPFMNDRQREYFRKKLLVWKIQFEFAGSGASIFLFFEKNSLLRP